MIDKNSFITIKGKDGEQHLYVSIDYFLDDILKIGEMRAGKLYDVGNYKIESWNEEGSKVFNKIISVKKSKSPTYWVDFDNKSGLQHVIVGEDCDLFIDGEFKNVKDLKEGDTLKGIINHYKVKEVKKYENDYIYGFRVDGSNCYFVDGVLVEGE